MQTPSDYNDNLIVGSAELPSTRTKKGICWVLPGNTIECDREAAIEYATKLDRIISTNLPKFSRTLFR